MSVFLIDNLVALVSGSIVVVVTAITLIKILMVNPNKFLAVNTLLLFVSNVADVGICITGYNLYNEKWKDSGNYSVFFVRPILAGVMFLTFNVSHFFIAWQYKELSQQVPLLFDGKQDQFDPNKNRSLYWFLLLTNFVSPVVAAVFYYFVLRGIFNPNYQATGFEVAAFEISCAIVTLAATVSGWILVRSVYRIRAFYKSRGQVESMDTKRTVVHATAFGLIIPSFLIAFGLLIAWVADETSASYRKFQTATTVGFLLSDVSEILLCVIFWHLSRKEPELTETADSSDIPRVSEFDEEAELMARIWNSFNRNESRDTEQTSASLA